MIMGIIQFAHVTSIDGQETYEQDRIDNQTTIDMIMSQVEFMPVTDMSYKGFKVYAVGQETFENTTITLEYYLV